MFKKLRKNEKGFTLAELLIVVAIIGVLVAISIPIFTSQLEKSREAVDLANVRSAYAEVVANYLTDSKASSITVSASQTESGWQGAASQIVNKEISAQTKGSSYVVAVDASGNVTVNGVTIQSAASTSGK